MITGLEESVSQSFHSSGILHMNLQHSVLLSYIDVVSWVFGCIVLIFLLGQFFNNFVCRDYSSLTTTMLKFCMKLHYMGVSVMPSYSLSCHSVPIGVGISVVLCQFKGKIL